MRKIALLLMASSWSLFAQEQIYLQYCFKDSQSARTAMSRIGFLKAPADTLSVDGSCLDVVTSSRRKDLFDKVMTTKFGVSSILSTAGSKTPSECRLLVKSVKRGNSTDTLAGANNKGIHAQQVNNNSSGTSTSTLVVSSGKEGSIQVGKDVLKVTCTVTSAGYNLDIALENHVPNKDPIPQYDSQGRLLPPPDTKSFALSTTRFLTKGTTIELGSITRDLKNKARTAGVPSGVDVSSSNGIEQETVYLTIQ